MFLFVDCGPEIGKEKIDMKRMQNILERCLLEIYSSFESTPHEAVAYPVIADILYGQQDKDVSGTLCVCVCVLLGEFSHHVISSISYS